MVVYGGRRSGKSYAISQILTLRSVKHKRKIACCRKVGRTLRLSVYPRIEAALLEAGIPYTKNKTDMTFTLPNGSQFICLGMDDPEKIKSIEGITDYWLEEFTEFTEADFDTLDAGLSEAVTPQPCVIMSFNPIPTLPGVKNWIQQRFLDGEFPMGVVKRDGNTAVLRTCYKQNKFCPQHVIDVLEHYKQTNMDLYKMWALGEFTTLQGAILHDWDIVDSVPEGVSEGHYGLDFGFSNDPAALVKTWTHNDDIYIREEIYETGLTNQALGRRMRSAGVSGVIIGDSAEPKSIQEIREQGFSIKGYRKSPDYKRAAARWLQGKHIHILKGSTNLIREISAWSWETDRHGNQLPRPADGDDHGVDASIYALYDNNPEQHIVMYG